MIEDEVPAEALRRLSHRAYVDEGKWLEAVRTVTRAEEDFKERKDLRGGGLSGATRGKKRKFEDSKPTVAATHVKKQYTAQEKAAQKKKPGERKVKKEGSVAPAGEVKHAVWADAHKGVDQKVVDKHQQKAILRQMQLCCVLTLVVWTLRPVRPVHPVVRLHMWLRLVRLDTLLSTGFRPDTCN